MLQKKALIIRFSSFGDIVQASFAAESLSQKGFEVDLITKTEFRDVFKSEGFCFKNVLGLSKSASLGNLWRLSGFAADQNYSLIYDAHNNQRTLLFKLLLCLRSPSLFFTFNSPFRKRSKFRIKRFLLFKLRINKFPKPFKGALSFLEPLNIELTEQSKKNNSGKRILLAPSAAWDLKKWPEEHWVELAKNLQKDFEVAFLGGPSDEFIGSLHRAVPQSINLAGKLSWTQTVNEIKKARALISGDTGVLHVADFFGVPAVALMGPSAFGFTSRESTKTISKDLPCQPCSKDGRGKCKLKETKKCLTLIKPEEVSANLKEAL